MRSHWATFPHATATPKPELSGEVFEHLEVKVLPAKSGNNAF